MNNKRSRRVGRVFWLLAASLGASSVWAQAPTPAAAAPATVEVLSYRVVGNTLLDEKLVYGALAAWRGRRTLEELRRAAEAVQRLYAEAGYGGVVAFLPPQQGEPGTVTIRVLEGKISAVRVQGARFHSDDSVRAALPGLQVGRTPRLRDIDSQIELANENPSRRIQVLLRPGAQPGDVAADLTVLDRAPQSWSLSLDDTGNSRTGHYRAGLGWQHANVLGIDDVASLQYQTSLTKPGQVSVFSAFYRHPLPAAAVVLDGYLAVSDVDGGSSATAAGNLRINGRGQLAGVRATWLLPRWREVDHRLSLALDRRAYLNRCDIDGLGSQACGSAGSDVTVTPLSLDYALRGSTPFSWTTTFTALGNLKLGGGNATAEDFAAQRPGARQGFGSLRLAATAEGSFAEGWQLRGRLATQWTKQALVAGEEFGLGGAVSVRGYEERELVGDKGLAFSLEVTGPEWLTRKTQDEGSLRPFGFVDAGAVANNLDAPCKVDGGTRCSLSSAGLGLSFERQRLQARLAAAVALKDGPITRRGDTRAHFSANLSF